MIILHLFIFILAICSHVPITNAVPCKIEDVECMKNTTIYIMRTTFNGVPEIGIEPIDPSTVETIDISWENMQLVFKNVTGSGIAKCVTSRIRVDVDSLELDLLCPLLMMTSNYKAKGQVLFLPIQGEGDVYLKSGKILATVLTKHKKVKMSDGKNHWQLAISQVKAEAIDPIQFDITNLFNGRKELSDAFIKFAHENWKALSELLLEPVMRTGLEEAVKRLNTYLGIMKTYEEIISD